MEQPKSCNLDLPYPPVEVSEKNTAYAKQLLTEMTGELGAIIGYEFAETVFADDYPALAELISCVSQTEMRHYAMLSELIYKLGVEPRAGTFHRGHFRYFCADGVQYLTKPVPAVEGFIADERAAAKDYERLSVEMRDPSVSRVLARISLDEEHHAKLFARALQDLG